MAANYNNSAWFYDRLSRLVYGRALVNAQVYLLKYIDVNSHVLIVGGGTGWVLEELTQMHPSELRITYVEVSKNMMALSKKRNIGSNQVVFINDAVENVSLTTRFDVVMTAFLFDSFSDQTCQNLFGHINNLLKPGGKWLYSDFQLTGKWWQNILLKSMLLFFKIVCKIEASGLPDVEKYFEQSGYKTISEQTFFNDFIISKVYSRDRNSRHL
jgi:ubiquinone/menaquinone biosynthesis C-methylase UbiE